MALPENLTTAVKESVAAHEQWALAVVDMNVRFNEPEGHQERLERAFAAHESMVEANQRLVAKSLSVALERMSGERGCAT
jgi:hypothetical protein